MRPFKLAPLASLAILVATVMTLILPAPSQAAVGARWKVSALVNRTAAEPGATLSYNIVAYDDGDADTEPGACPGPQCQTLAITLPDGLVAESVQGVGWACIPDADSRHITCTSEEVFSHSISDTTHKLAKILMLAKVTPEATGTEVAAFALSGGGATGASIRDAIEIGPEAPFGIEALDGAAEDSNGQVLTTAAAHPTTYSNTIAFNHGLNPLHGGFSPMAPMRDTEVELPPGLVGNPTALPTCTAAQLSRTEEQFVVRAECPPASQVGVVALTVKFPKDKVTLGAEGFPGAATIMPVSVYSMAPPPGVAARFGFNLAGVIVVLDASVRGGSDYGITVASRNANQALALLGTRFEFWGLPSSSSHDFVRSCPGFRPPYENGPTCSAEGDAVTIGQGGEGEGVEGESGPVGEVAFLRNPTNCAKEHRGLTTTVRADSWRETGVWKEAGFNSHEVPGYPTPPTEWGDEIGITDCDSVAFNPSISVAPTTNRADSPTGLEVDLSIPQGSSLRPQRDRAVGPQASHRRPAPGDERQPLLGQRPRCLRFRPDRPARHRLPGPGPDPLHRQGAQLPR